MNYSFNLVLFITIQLNITNGIKTPKRIEQGHWDNAYDSWERCLMQWLKLWTFESKETWFKIDKQDGEPPSICLVRNTFNTCGYEANKHLNTLIEKAKWYSSPNFSHLKSRSSLELHNQPTHGFYLAQSTLKEPLGQLWIVTLSQLLLGPWSCHKFK